MITRFSDQLCGCCSRTATGFGFVPKSGQPTLFVCDSPECLTVAKDSYTLPQETFSILEAKAAVEASNAMGMSLDRMGEGHRFDGISGEAWLAAMREAIIAYRTSLVELLKSEAPF